MRRIKEAPVICVIGGLPEIFLVNFRYCWVLMRKSNDGFLIQILQNWSTFGNKFYAVCNRLTSPAYTPTNTDAGSHKVVPRVNRLHTLVTSTGITPISTRKSKIYYYYKIFFTPCCILGLIYMSVIVHRTHYYIQNLLCSEQFYTQMISRQGGTLQYLTDK